MSGRNAVKRCIMSSNDPTFELIAALYEAAVEPELWPQAMTRLADYVAAFDVTLIYWDQPNPDVRFVVSAGRYSPDAVALYERHYSQLDPAAQAAARLPAGQPVLIDRLIDQDTVKRSAYYNEFLIPNGGRYVMGGVLLDAPHARATIGFHRGLRDGPFDAADRSLLQPLFPHLARIAGVHGKLVALNQAATLGQQALDQLPFALFACEANGRVRFMNDAASRLVITRDGLDLRGGVLLARDVAANERLQALLVMAARRRTGGSLLLGRADGKPPLALHVVPLAPPRLRVAADATRGPGLLVMVSDPARTADTAGRLRGLYRLTRREAILVDSLIAGASVEETAARMGITVGTARTYLKRILAKTGTTRQGALVATVLRALRPVS